MSTRGGSRPDLAPAADPAEEPTAQPHPEPSAEPPARRRPTRSQVRQDLLDAAAEQFARRGIDAASLEDVAAAAGYTKGAVYSNFGSKQGLVDALVEDRTVSYLDLGVAAVDAVVPADGEGSSLAEMARVLGDGLTAASRDQRDWHLLFVELWQRAVREPDRAGAFATHRERLRRDVSAAAAARLPDAGAALPLSTDDLATVVMALTNGLAMERLVAPEHVPDRLLGDVLSLLAGAQPTD